MLGEGGYSDGDATSRPAILGVCVFSGETPAGCAPSVCVSSPDYRSRWTTRGPLPRDRKWCVWPGSPVWGGGCCKRRRQWGRGLPGSWVRLPLIWLLWAALPWSRWVELGQQTESRSCPSLSVRCCGLCRHLSPHSLATPQPGRWQQCRGDTRDSGVRTWECVGGAGCGDLGSWGTIWCVSSARIYRVKK